MQQQTYADFECIIVNDHATDETPEIVKTFAKGDSRFKLVNNQYSKGAAGARNTGIDLARGTYISFLDSDDILLPHAFENRLNAFDMNPKLDMIVTNQLKIEEHKPATLVNVKTDEPVLLRFFSMSPYCDIPWVNNTLLAKKVFIKRHKIRWQESLERYQDIQFNIDLLLAEPNYQWVSTCIDAHWHISKHKPSIGNDNTQYVHKLIDLANFYLGVLARLPKPFKKYKGVLLKKVKSFLVYSHFHVSREESSLLANFIREKKLLNKTLIKLLHQYHQSNNLLWQKTIRLIFKLKLYQSFGQQNFLQHEPISRG